MHTGNLRLGNKLASPMFEVIFLFSALQGGFCGFVFFFLEVNESKKYEELDCAILPEFTKSLQLRF